VQWSKTVEIFYPIDRLLANPRIFYAIANQLEGPDAETLKTCFYELLEHGFEEFESPEECEFTASEALFRIDEDNGNVEIIFDSGIASVLSPIAGEARALITNEHEMAATTAMYKRLVTAIEASNPEFQGDIALCSPPTPGNSYLQSESGEGFEGSFHLLSDPNRQFAFTIDIVDVEQDILRATYKPI